LKFICIADRMIFCPYKIRVIRIKCSESLPMIEIMGYYFNKTTFLVGQTFLSVVTEADNRQECLFYRHLLSPP